jgi:WD40 repeat protein
VVAIAFSPDGTLLAWSSMFDSKVQILKVPSLKTAQVLPLIPKNVLPNRYGIVRDSTVVEGLDFSPAGKRLAAGCWDLTAKLWELKRGALQELSPEHKENVDFVGFLKDGKTFISATAGAVRLWDVKRRKMLKEAQVRSGQYIWEHALAADADRLVSVGDKGKVRVWDLRTWTYEQFAHGLKRRVTAFAVSPDGKSIALGCSDGRIAIFDVATQRQRDQLRLARAIDQIAYTDRGASLTCVVSGGESAARTVWRAKCPASMAIASDVAAQVETFPRSKTSKRR